MNQNVLRRKWWTAELTGNIEANLQEVIEYQKILDVNFYTHVAPRTVPYLDENLSNDAL